MAIRGSRGQEQVNIRSHRRGAESAAFFSSQTFAATWGCRRYGVLWGIIAGSRAGIPMPAHPYACPRFENQVTIKTRTCR